MAPSSTPTSTRRARTTSAIAFVIASDNGRIGVVQIAGLIARRIVCFVREGATVGAGERIGMIRFGSRVDVYLPEGVRPLVAEGRPPSPAKRSLPILPPATRNAPSGSVKLLIDNG